MKTYEKIIEEMESWNLLNEYQDLLSEQYDCLNQLEIILLHKKISIVKEEILKRMDKNE
jgi:hypothetical protein